MAFGITAAGWLAAGSMVGGALINKRSVGKAADAQGRAAQDANATTLTAQREAQAFQQKQADQARADQEPWRVAGGNALTQLSQRMAPGGDLMRNFAMSDFQEDPGYQFRLAEGQKGLNNSLTARGMALSGAALKATTNYNQGAASQEFGNAFARYKGNQEGQYNKLASLAGVGQIAANQNGSSAMQLGSSVGNALMYNGQNMGRNIVGAGDARASGYLAQGNALTGAVNQGVSMWKQYNERPQTPGAQNITPGSWSE